MLTVLISRVCCILTKKNYIHHTLFVAALDEGDIALLKSYVSRFNSIYEGKKRMLMTGIFLITFFRIVGPGTIYQNHQGGRRRYTDCDEKGE